MKPELFQDHVRYDAVSRALHGVMALLFAAIYCSAAARYFLQDSAVDKWLWPAHKPLGLLLFMLVVVRIAWSVVRQHARPTRFSRAAQMGHWALYALMVAIPFIGLLRQYGSGRAFSVFELPVFQERVDNKTQWMIDVGSNFHGVMGWTLLALITGHIAAVIVHYLRGDRSVLRRMWGSAQRV